MPRVRTPLELKEDLISAGKNAVEELIKVAKATIIKGQEDVDRMLDDENSLAADKMKTAAQAKKLAIFDALDILDRIEAVEQDLREAKESEGKPTVNASGGFAERRSK